MFSIIRSTNRLGSNTPKQDSSIANNKEMNLGLILFLASQLRTQKLQSTNELLLLLPELPNGSFQTWVGELGVCTREEDKQTRRERERAAAEDGKKLGMKRASYLQEDVWW
jgi:hypothetical protein